MLRRTEAAIRLAEGAVAAEVVVQGGVAVEVILILFWIM
jgi:hypothetical protein